MRFPPAGLAALFLLHILPFVGRPALIGGDEPHYALMAHSIAVDGDLDLEDDYLEVEAGSQAAGSRQAGKTLARHLREFGDRTVFSHPLGLPLLVAPLLWLLQLIKPGAAPDLLLGLLGLTLTFVALLEGLRLLTGLVSQRRQALIVGLAIYFTTPLWFYSRTFFTEPYVWSLLVLAVGQMDRGRDFTASLLLGLTLLIKETAILAIVPILLATWRLAGIRRCLELAVAPALALVLFCLKNRVVYGEWLVTFQAFQLGSPVTGTVGVLFDPRHGLLPFTPLAVLGFLGWLQLNRQKRVATSPSLYAWLVFLGYFVVTALWVDWRGGSGYGPRLLVPALPAFSLPLVQLMVSEERKPWLGLGFGTLAVVGFAIQWCAVTNPFNAFWSISVTEMILGRPLAAISGLLLGSASLVALARPSLPRRSSL